MKQIITLLALMFSYMLCGAQATTLVVDNQIPGWLSSKINYGDQQTVENLTVTGYINKNDLSFIGSLMSKHALTRLLDLSDVFLVGATQNDDNTINFDNIFDLNNVVTIDTLALPTRISTPKKYSSEKPLRNLNVNTLIYGGNECNEYNNALWGYVYSGGSGAQSSPKHLILREGVSLIASYSFDNYTYNSYGGGVEIETVHCPNTLKTIESSAFRDCTSLRFINLTDNIETIQKGAFEGSSFKPDTLKLPNSLREYYTNSFPIKKGQVIILGENVERFDNESWTLTQNTVVTYIINSVIPPIFRKGARYSSYNSSYSDGKELTGCTLYVPKEGYSMYVDPEYNSVGTAGTWSGWTNPYSHANVKTIPVHVNNITLSQSSANLNVGSSINLIANVLPANADNIDVIWSSSNTNVAKVNNDGLVTAISCGNAFITATSKENPQINTSCEIEVHQPLQSISLSSKSIVLKAGEIYDGLSISYYPSTADNKEVIWLSSNESIAFVDNRGKVIAIKGGETVVSVTSVENPEIKDECTVTVIQPVTGLTLNKSTLDLIENESEKLSVSILPENASNKGITWTSSDVSVAMVSPNGTVYAIKPGEATIMATTVDGGFVALCKVTVKAKTILAETLSLSATNSEMTVGETLQLSATVLPENTSNKDVSWTSTNTDVATVTASGLVHAIKGGNVQIIASTTDGSGMAAICTVVVEDGSGIDNIEIDSNEYVKIFNLHGVLVYEGKYSESHLTPGIYIIVSQGNRVKQIIR